MHHKKRNHSRKCRNLFFRLRHANGNTHRKDDRQIIKNDVSCLAHDHKQCMQDGSITKNPL